MPNHNHSVSATCAVTGRPHPPSELVPLDALRPAIVERLQRLKPDIAPSALVGRDLVDEVRSRYITELLQQERGELSELDREVADSLARSELIAEDTDAELEESRTFGQRLSDGLASFGGSWRFLIAFAVILSLWMAFNVISGQTAFDPYPFILLNLVLSCLAAVQAPVIMMSQQRQEAKDRARARNDYQVNLKAELEIRHLHEKLDHLINRQWQRLAEIQSVQIELLQELRKG